MEKKREFIGEMTEALTERNFVRENKTNKKQMEKMLSKPQWKEFLKELPKLADKDGRFDSVKVAELGEQKLDVMKDIPPEGWPLHTFRYVCNQLFPHMPGAETPEKYRTGREFFLQILRGLYNYEYYTLPFDPTFDFQMLSDEQVEEGGFIKEYIKLKKVISAKYIYEFMRIGNDIMPFNAVGHVGGVHYVAMLMAYQLYRAGVPVDLALISGAAAGHDIGKYGCKKSEEKRIPYLHYYYTDQCFRKFDLPKTGHIAGNHSTWDLELENLSVESLLLIYADFRVKSTRTEDKTWEIVHFYTLDESYQVILDKLDNVDEAKKKRYQKVYAKLKDFENYMKEQGVNTDVPPDFSGYESVEIVPNKRDVVLLKGDQIVDQLKFAAIDHNIRLMGSFHSDRKFANIIEDARSEKQWKSLRTYISILEEYSTYMTEVQKTITMKFLQELLVNKEGDVRSSAAAVLGQIVARFSEEFKKELPEGIMVPDKIEYNLGLFRDNLEHILYPDYKFTEQHKKWLNSCFSPFVSSVLKHCTDSVRHRYVAVVEEYYKKWDYDEALTLVFLQTLMELDRELCTEEFIETVKVFLAETEKRDSIPLRIASQLAAFNFDPDYDDEVYYDKVAGWLNIPEEKEQFQEYLGTMFLNDLKAGTSWVEKVANISFMIRYGLENVESSYLLHIATHFANLIKVSEYIIVRRYAGRGLLAIIEKLPYEQRNEITVELFNGLEIGDYQFAKYIPDYLGVIILDLPDVELDEIIEDMRKVIVNGDDKAASSVIDTFGVIISNYDMYRAKFGESKEDIEKRKNKIFNIILKSYASYRNVISQEALFVIGKIFNSAKLSYHQKDELFTQFAKKILYLMSEMKEEDLDFFNNAATLIKIYRFIGNYQADVGEFVFRENSKVAFFPGTFDPFSLGHKTLATTIRDMGFDVYLALDEFSWSKNTQPRLLRRKIMMMSVAEEDSIYIFPEDLPVNIANPSDIGRLKAAFPGKEVYIAVGSDVITNASSYKQPPTENSIHTLNHIAFEREVKVHTTKSEDKAAFPITADVIRMTLPKEVEDISSTKIRQNVDMDRDISNLIDEVAGNFIYENNMYLREPEFKHVLEAKDIHISFYGRVPKEVLDMMEGEIQKKGLDFDQVEEYINDRRTKSIYLLDGGTKGETLAIASVRKVASDKLYSEFGDTQLPATIRKNARGKIAVIGLMVSRKNRNIVNLNQYLITEILTSLVARDYTYAVYHPISETTDHGKIVESLKRQGFVNIAGPGEKPVYAVDMSSPMVVFKDVETVVKNPFNKNVEVQSALEEAHNNLLKTLTDIYPGKLVLSFNTSAVYNKIVKMVAKINGVSVIPSKKNIRGPYMSVPFGKALSSVVVPNTVTKALHTEKYFRSDLKSFSIGEQKNYGTLDNQTRTIKSFNRPVILIDDLMNKGYRMDRLQPLLEKHDVEVKAMVTGVMSGNGEDDMRVRGFDIESAYFIPTISLWLNEKDSYPFIGGDGLQDEKGENVDQINLIMPYSFPKFIDGGNRSSVFRYSLTCLENAYNLLRTLEREYQKKFEKKLTLKRLGEVISVPRRPDLGEGVSYDETLAPSSYVKKDIIRLKRMAGGELESGKERI